MQEQREWVLGQVRKRVSDPTESAAICTMVQSVTLGFLPKAVKRTVGMYKFANNSICLNTRYLSLLTSADWIDTIRHEFGHLMVQAVRPELNQVRDTQHGSVWQNYTRMVGGSASQFHKGEAPYKYQVCCTTCGTRGKKYFAKPTKFLQTKICKRCRGKFSLVSI